MVPDHPVALAPINNWPLNVATVTKWFVGFPGYLWPYNALWFLMAALTWTFLTPSLESMRTLELWWVAIILVRNLALVTLVFGGLHAYLYIFRGRGMSSGFPPEDRKLVPVAFGFRTKHVTTSFSRWLLQFRLPPSTKWSPIGCSLTATWDGLV